MKNNERAIERKESTKAILIALGSNTVISVVKFIGYFLSLSPSMLAEALHSVADSFNQLLLLLGVRYTSIISTKTHPWGTGIKQYIFNLFSAMGVFVIGCVLTIHNAINTLMNPPQFSEKGLSISIFILIFSLALESYSLFKALEIAIAKMQKDGKNFLEYATTTDDSSLLAIVLEDGVAVIGLFIALIGVGVSKYCNSSIPDAIAAIIIGVILGIISLFLFKNNLTFILGKSTDEAKQQEIRDFITGINSVEHMDDLKTEVLGPSRVHLIAEIDIDHTSLIDKNQIKRDAELIRKDPSKIYEVLIDTWVRGGRMVARELNDIDKELKEKFHEIEFTHFELVGGEHVNTYEVLRKDETSGLVHEGVLKVRGKLDDKKIIKSLIDNSYLEEVEDGYVVNFDEENDIVQVFLESDLILELRK